MFAGSERRNRSAAAAYHDEIVHQVEKGLTAKRIWQDLVEDYGYGHSYESVKRYIRGLTRDRQVVVVRHSKPGEKVQVDFFKGAPSLHPERGQWRRPWVFRMTLCCSRHGYEEAVWDQRVETFLALHERAFFDLGGVVEIVRHDNMKAAVVPSERFAFFKCGERPVHPDRHVEVEGSYYLVPPRLLGQRVQARWDKRQVRIFHNDVLVASHLRVEPGTYAHTPGNHPVSSTQTAFILKILGRCE